MKKLPKNSIVKKNIQVKMLEKCEFPDILYVLYIKKINIIIFVFYNALMTRLTLLINVVITVFIKCELVLFSANLYGWPLSMVTMTAASYTIQR